MFSLFTLYLDRIKMKLLFISNIGGKKVGNFSLSSRMAAKELGIEFHIACNFSMSDQQMREEEKHHGIKLHHIDFMRNPFHPANIKAYKQLLALMKREKYDVIHCNTPVGGFLGRLCAKKAGATKVIYMAHGFHFFRGAPIFNWLLYFPVERILAHITDFIITINREDFECAKRFNLRNGGRVYYVPGVGVDFDRFQNKSNECRDQTRKKLGVPEDAIIVLSVGELNKNKNHQIILKAIANIDNENIYYCIAGKGHQEKYLRSLAKKLGINERVVFLGFRNDIDELYHSADIFAFPSKREGLGIAAIEAMASGLPLVTSNVHGIVDYSINGVTGFTCAPNDEKSFGNALEVLINNKELRKMFGKHNIEGAKKFDRSNAKGTIKNIYREIIC